MEGLSKAALIKSLSPRVMLSNHLLPKGTKMKVNLEDQGRQKVSFSFAQTKKPLQNLFFIPTNPDKPVTEPQPSLSQSNSDKGGQSTEGKTEQKLTPVVPISTAETHSQIAVSPATKVKTDLPKMHFKKQILSVTEEIPTSAMAEETDSSELQKSTSKSVTEFPTPLPQNVVNVCPSENAHAEAPETKATPSLKTPAVSSGKDGESSSSVEQDSNVYKRKTRSQSDSAPPGSESDGDSVQMSSSRKSVDPKRKMSSDNRSKEVKKSSFGLHAEEKDKGSSKRSENHERSSSYSKSDRDSRYPSSRSSRSDKDRRRTRSRSRSRSRGSRTSSSHSRSERCRGDRGSRSDRSYYHDSERRSHRSSPRRDRRRSRSRTDRTRDSSDSEDDHRKTRTRTSDSSRLSAHSSSYKDFKSSSYSKSEKAYKSADSPHSSEDKRTQASRSERTSKRLSDSDSQRKCSPDPDSGHRKSSSHHKSESNSKLSSSSIHSYSQTYEKRQKGSSSDSEADHKGKSQASDKSSSSEENYRGSQRKSSRSDSRQMTPPRSSVKSSEHDRQSNDVFHSPDKETPCANIAEWCSQTEMEISGSQQSGQAFKEMVSSTDGSLQESSAERKETKSGLEDQNENASAVTFESLKQVNANLENLTNVKDSLSLNSGTHVSLSAAVLNSCSTNDNVVCGPEKKACSPEPTSLHHTADLPCRHHAQQSSKPENVELSIVSAVSEQCGANVPLKSDSSSLEPGSQLTLKQQYGMDTVKKSSSTTKKSRWDIVGQDISDSDHSQRTICAENKPTVKKVISVKKIEFSKDVSQQGSDIKDAVQQETDTHSKQVKPTEIFKQELDSESTSVMDRYKDQSEPSRESTSVDYCDVKLSVSQKTHATKPLHINDTPQVDKVAKMQSWIGNDHEDKSTDSAHQTKLSKRTSPNRDTLQGQSEASDSDNSEYDSDCGEAIKRLNSVVVVPKNSSLTMDTQDTGASPCIPSNRSELANAYAAADVSVGDESKQRRGDPSTAFAETSGPHALMNDSFNNSMLCQSQSNMIDSTSHSEGSSSIHAQPCVVGHVSAHGRASDSANRLDISRQCGEGHKQHNVDSRGEKMFSHYQQNDFSNANSMSEKNGFGIGWDFLQAEQPSSTYQQPDSSHGPHLPCTKLTEASHKQQEHVQSHTSWNHQSLNMQTNRKPYHHMHEHYQDPASEIHPDSLTNDHDDDSRDKPSNLSKTAVECSGPNTFGSSSFVQGHEISSNSRGATVPDPPRDESFRPHRGRGPPKKRRPEIESDSDNEAEAGPADKKERLEDGDETKESHAKAVMPRPSLTLQDFQDANKWKELSKSKKMPPYFDLIEENLYLTER